jgi:GT2 family glycosyltransferase
MKCAYVILHYSDIDITVKCISSLLKIRHEDGGRPYIYIVDNASPNGSGQVLKDKYSDAEQIKVILNTENAGFARGNNAGIRQAREDGFDFIAVLNNDIEVPDADFEEKLWALYEREKFAVYGPDIVKKITGEHQNPSRGTGITVKDVGRDIMLYRIWSLINTVGMYDRVQNYLSAKKAGTAAGKKMSAPSACIPDPGKYQVLHGSFIVLGPDFLAVRDGFNEMTYMYGEEDILAYECQRDGMKLYYSPEISVIHYAGISTKAAHSGNRKRTAFGLKNRIRSLKKMRRLIWEADH